MDPRDYYSSQQLNHPSVVENCYGITPEAVEEYENMMNVTFMEIDFSELTSDRESESAAHLDGSSHHSVGHHGGSYHHGVSRSGSSRHRSYRHLSGPGGQGYYPGNN